MPIEPSIPVAAAPADRLTLTHSSVRSGASTSGAYSSECWAFASDITDDGLAPAVMSLPGSICFADEA